MKKIIASLLLLFAVLIAGQSVFIDMSCCKLCRISVITQSMGVAVDCAYAAQEENTDQKEPDENKDEKKDKKKKKKAEAEGGAEKNELLDYIPFVAGAVGAVIIIAAIVVFILSRKPSQMIYEKIPDIGEFDDTGATEYVRSMALRPEQTGSGGEVGFGSPQQIRDYRSSEEISFYKLIGISGALAGKTYDLNRYGEKGLTIGRTDQADIRYPADAKGVSRVHCRIFIRNGGPRLMDLGSTYGTYIAGKGKLKPKVVVKAEKGDTIIVGDPQNRFIIK